MSSVGKFLEWVPMVDLATGNWRGIAEKAAGPEMDPHEIHGAAPGGRSCVLAYAWAAL